MKKTNTKDTARIAALQRELTELSARIAQQEQHTADLEERYRTARGDFAFNGDPELFKALPEARATLGVLRTQLKELERALEHAQAEATAADRAKQAEEELASARAALLAANDEIAAGHARLAALEKEERTAAAALDAAMDVEAEAQLDGVTTDPEAVPKAERAHALARRMVEKMKERISKLGAQRAGIMDRISGIEYALDDAQVVLHRRALQHHLDAMIPPLQAAYSARYRMHGFAAAESEIPDLGDLLRGYERKCQETANA